MQKILKGVEKSYDPGINVFDAEYMSAVESGDMDKAERMVRDAAMAACYNLEAYHDTSGTTITIESN